MNKYISTDKLIKEIERLIGVHTSIFGALDEVAMNLNYLKKFIASLQQEIELPEKYQTPDWLWKKMEQPEVDLDEELDKFYGMYRKDGKTYDITDDEEVSDWKDCGNFLFKIEFARHFYELGLNSRKEQPEADLEHIENDAELIANGIMIGVQSNRYHTCVYNTERNDFNHSHLVQAARKGIELGLKARRK